MQLRGCIINEVAGGQGADVRFLECLMETDGYKNAAPVTGHLYTPLPQRETSMQYTSDCQRATTFKVMKYTVSMLGIPPLHYAPWRSHLAAVKDVVKLFVNANIAECR